MGFFNYLFAFFYTLLSSKKKTFRYAMDGVDMVKYGLFFYLLSECEANFPKEYIHSLVAAVINTIFYELPSNEVGEQFIDDENNLNKVHLVIEKVIKPEEKIKQLITDAVKVKSIASYVIKSKISTDDFGRFCFEPIENLKQLGLFIPGGEKPDLSTFMGDASTFLEACKADLDYHRSRMKDA